MNPSAKLSELIDALEFESEETVTRFDRQTGRIISVDRHILSAFEEGDEDELGELPDWQKEQLEIARAVAGDDGERFIAARGCVKSADTKFGNDHIFNMANFDETSRWMRWSKNEFLHRLAPDKFDFHEYRQMERFIGTVESTPAAEELWRAIKGKGAFRFFKDTANRLGLLDQWYRYRDAAVKEYVLAWAEANQVTVEDDAPAHPRNDQ